LESFPDRARFVRAGFDQVTISWVNKRLEEIGEAWRVAIGREGYVLPNLE